MAHYQTLLAQVKKEGRLKLFLLVKKKSSKTLKLWVLKVFCCFFFSFNFPCLFEYMVFITEKQFPSMHL